MSTKNVYKMCTKTVLTKMFRRCQQKVSGKSVKNKRTKSVHKMCPQNVSTKGVHKKFPHKNSPDSVYEKCGKNSILYF